MIQIKDKTECCGCTACYSICPRKAITMTEDQEGFLYPVVNMKTCIDCGLCENVCPIVNNAVHEVFERKSYVVRAKDKEILSRSTSGGFVTPLAEWVLEQGGVFCGAAFGNGYHIVHKIAKSISCLWQYRGSKYVQSELGDCFTQIKGYLEQGTMVCFVGTTCQVHGLKSYLRNGFKNLITVDLVCHGTPSPKLWE